MTQPGIEPRSPGPLVNRQAIFSRFKDLKFVYKTILLIKTIINSLTFTTTSKILWNHHTLGIFTEDVFRGFVGRTPNQP